MAADHTPRTRTLQPTPHLTWGLAQCIHTRIRMPPIPRTIHASRGPKAVRRTIDEEELVDLPTLPLEWPYVLQLESDFEYMDGRECPSLDNPINAEPAPEDYDPFCETEGLWSPEEVDRPQLTISFRILQHPWDGFIENFSHPLAKSMPGLFDMEHISISSRLSQVSSLGDDDPNGLCAEALEGTILVLQMRGGHAIEASEAEADDSPQRLDMLRACWFDKCADLMGPILLELPPMRAINHEINLIDNKAIYHFHQPRCPESLRSQLYDKIQRYISAGWWELTPVPQAAPMLCIPKKDTKL
ncbi:hypothetical protein C8J57DRAFT_1538301 [Mycena rebaudengoi]|nr:hypothetical protein C8J57DRAFT_1538301 [Mycena rebaudengoi]